MRQGGNQWSGFCAYASFMQEVAKLPIDWSVYEPWKDLAIHGSFRIVHEEFCIISDRPEILTVDEENRPHGENEPFCRWSDGTAIYAWHGTYVPEWWYTHRDELTPEIALKWENIDQREAACEIVGWDRILDELQGVTIDKHELDMVGELIEVDIPDIGRKRFLRGRCGTGRKFALPVPNDMQTALQANAWSYQVPEEVIKQIEVRT